MKRVLSLVLALVLVLGMMPTAFAADMSGAEMLLDNGFISGKDGATVDAKLDVNAKLTRAQLAALIAELNGAKEEAAAFAQPADFTDADTFQDWAKPFIAYAQQNEWMNGYPDGTFRADAEVPANQLAAVLLNALGYEFEYGTVLETAAGLGIMVEGTALTRGEAFEAMWTAVSEVPMNTEAGLTLGVFLGKLEPATPVVTDLTVKSVSATNLREVMVEFNNEIDADTLDKANFTIGGTAADSVALSEDGMTVTAIFTLANQSTYTLKIAEIADVNGSEVKDFSQQFTVNDFVAPMVTGVEIVGNKKLVVTFSEPVQPAQASILSNYKIDGLLFGATVTVDGRTVTLVTSTRLAEGVHNVEVNANVVDYANFKLVANKTEFVVANDTTVAALASLDSATQTKVVVTLSKPVEGTFTVTTGNGVALVSKTSKDNQTWTLNFAKAAPLPLSGTEITLKDVVDYYGNKGDIKFNVVPTLDLTRPEVVSVTATSQTELLVKFSKDVMAAGSFVIKTTDATPVTVPVTAVAYDKNDDNEDILTDLVLTGAFDADEYKVEFTAVTDTTVQANVMVPYTATITVADLTKPVVTDVKVLQPTTTTTGSIIVEFSEKVDAATALDKANYSYILNSTKPVALGTSHTVELLADGKSVKITVPKNATANAGDVVTSVTIINVTDVAANKMVAKIATALSAIPAANITVSAPVATATNKVVVTVSANINPATVTASDFRIDSTSGTVYVINAEYSSDDNEITLTLSSDLTVDALVGTTAAQLKVIAGNLADIYGNKVAGTPATTPVLVGTVADGIAPSAVKVATANSSATNAVVKVNLTEALDTTTLDKAYMVVKINGVIYTAANYTVTYGLDGTTPQLTFDVTVTADMTGKSYSVEFFKHVGTEDAAGNKLANFSFTGTLE